MLPHKVKDGVVKLIPKKPDKQRLQDWRPLTMLNTLYKLLTKLLANRLKVVLPQLISPQQTGFVPGRNILDNIALAWMTKDFINHNKIPALFLQIDFEKAFDRIEHSYLWAVLEKLGLGGKFLELTKALATDASSKAHVNGLFTDDIQVTRGVRQGCPLSPLIFALATQPLMDHLQHLLDTQLEGIQISETLTVSYRLFADDLGIFIPATQTAFQQILAALATYETASGSKINLRKTTIIPFNLPTIPRWLSQSGCHISSPHTVHKYLGAPWGANILSHQLHTFCQQRIDARLSAWSSRYLSFAG